MSFCSFCKARLRKSPCLNQKRNTVTPCRCSSFPTVARILHGCTCFFVGGGVPQLSTSLVSDVSGMLYLKDVSLRPGFTNWTRGIAKARRSPIPTHTHTLVQVCAYVCLYAHTRKCTYRLHKENTQRERERERERRTGGKMPNGAVQMQEQM